MGAALEFAFDEVISPGNRVAFPDLIIVITDGRSSDDPTESAKRLRASGVRNKLSFYYFSFVYYYLFISVFDLYSDF